MPVIEKKYKEKKQHQKDVAEEIWPDCTGVIKPQYILK